MGPHETQRTVSALTFLEQYHKYGAEFLSHIIQVTCNETWGSFVNVETTEQQMYTHLANKPKFHQTLLAFS
jgi:hypothetical protein